jgi:hypothetical protein
MSNKDATDDFFSIMASIENGEKLLKKARRLAKNERSAVRILRHSSWWILVTAAFLAVYFAVWAKFHGPIWTIAASWACLSVSYLSIIVQPFAHIWIDRDGLKKIWQLPFTSMMTSNIQVPLEVDSKHFERLCALPRIELDMGLLALKYEGNFMEKRIAWIIGAIDKVGVIPGIVAVLVGIHKLDVLSPWAASIAYANVGLFALGAFANVYVLRYQRMIALCEKALEHQELELEEKTKQAKAQPQLQPRLRYVPRSIRRRLSGGDR